MLLSTACFLTVSIGTQYGFNPTVEVCVVVMISFFYKKKTINSLEVEHRNCWSYNSYVSLGRNQPVYAFWRWPAIQGVVFGVIERNIVLDNEMIKLVFVELKEQLLSYNAVSSS